VLKTIGYILPSLVLGFLAGFYLTLAMIVVISLAVITLIVSIFNQNELTGDSKENNLSFMIIPAVVFIVGMALGMGMEMYTELGTTIGLSAPNIFFLR